MPIITLINKNKKYFFNHPISILDIVVNTESQKVSSCIAGIVNGMLYDMLELIYEDSDLFIIYYEHRVSLNIIRCSCLHILSRAIKILWPDSKIATSHITDNGFYYDIDTSSTLTIKDLILLEKQMYFFINGKYDVFKKKINSVQLYKFFLEKKEYYKLIILKEYLNNNKVIYIYSHQGYIDIFNYPQVPNVNFCKYFKLYNISEAYWKGSKKNKILQRIHGTAWNNKMDLDAYLNNYKKIEKMDHRKINKQLDLYHIQKESPGMIFWHKNGWIIFRELKSFLREKLHIFGYQEVKTPLIMNRSLWKKTKHLDNYSQNMFYTSSEKHQFCIKPMNCPGHIQIFKQKLRSYKDLPIRISEFGNCVRNEPSGSLHGLMRIKEFTQDDGHIFCTEEQFKEEIKKCINMIFEIYKIFGFKKILVYLSTCNGKKNDKFDIFTKAEYNLSLILKQYQIPFEYQYGHGAFYGPKIEFVLFDSLNRSWQCGTIQLDFLLPKYLNAYYINRKNELITPILIHRAILGSIERFIGILTEEYSGCYPVWLSPIQISIVNITDGQLEYALKLKKKFLFYGLRVYTNFKNETLGFKIRECLALRVPYIIICGKKEMSENNITLRTFRGDEVRNVNTNDFIKKLILKIKNRSLDKNIIK